MPSLPTTVPGAVFWCQVKKPTYRAIDVHKQLSQHTAFFCTEVSENPICVYHEKLIEHESEIYKSHMNEGKNKTDGITANNSLERIVHSHSLDVSCNVT